MTRLRTAVLLFLAAPVSAAPPAPSDSELRVQRQAREFVAKLVAVDTVAANESKALGTEHLRTTNPIESTFATVKLRQRVTK